MNCLLFQLMPRVLPGESRKLTRTPSAWPHVFHKPQEVKTQYFLNAVCSMAALQQQVGQFLKLCRPHQVRHQRHNRGGFSSGADTGTFTLCNLAGDSGPVLRHVVDCSRIAVGSQPHVILPAYVERMLYMPDNVIFWSLLCAYRIIR